MQRVCTAAASGEAAVIQTLKREKFDVGIRSRCRSGCLALVPFQAPDSRAVTSRRRGISFACAARVPRDAGYARPMHVQGCLRIVPGSRRGHSYTVRTVRCPARSGGPLRSCAALRFRWLAAVAAVALTVPIWPEAFTQCNTVNSYSVTSLRSNGRNVEDFLGPEGPTRVTCKRIQCEAEPDVQAR